MKEAPAAYLLRMYLFGLHADVLKAMQCSFIAQTEDDPETVLRCAPAHPNSLTPATLVSWVSAERGRLQAVFKEAGRPGRVCL